MLDGGHRATLFTFRAVLLIACAACGQGAKLGPDAGPQSDAGVDAGPDADTGGPAVAVAVTPASLTFATPDLPGTLTAAVTGSADPTVTWSSSNTYIATVSAAGVVTSVSGGQAIITATSVADPTRSASSTVTIVEPDRAGTTHYDDNRQVSSGPIHILMAGDSLMRTYAANADDQAGWGQVLARFLTSDAAVDNTISDGGRSSRSFYNEVGRWDQIKLRLAAARTAGTPTFVFLMFAHNDQKKTTDDHGPDYLTFASHNQNGTVAGTFYDYLERYVVETRALGGIHVLLTPFVREYLQGSPATVSDTGQHHITAAYAGETAARGDYPAAMKAVAAKHDVPLVDITAWSKAMVEARAAAATLDYVYISSDQTHVRELGALVMAQEAVRQLGEQGILTGYATPAAPRLMLDAGNLGFGGVFAGNTLDRSFRISPFGDVSGTITITAPVGYTVSTDGGATFGASATIACDAAYVGTKVVVRFAPTDAIAYNADLIVAHSSLVLDYGNTVPGATPGTISLTGNGKAVTTGAPATATWPMFQGTAIVLDPTTEGAISASAATLTGLRNKNVANGGARFDTLDGTWPAEAARAAGRYVEYTMPVTAGTFTLGSISVGAGTGGGSNLRWDIVYSLNDDFSSPTDLGTGLNGPKDTLVTNTYPSLGLNITAGQTLRLRVYPYNTSAATGKSVLLANVVISGVTN